MNIAVSYNKCVDLAKNKIIRNVLWSAIVWTFNSWLGQV